jgi:hypothetical protein
MKFAWAQVASCLRRKYTDPNRLWNDLAECYKATGASTEGLTVEQMALHALLAVNDMAARCRGAERVAARTIDPQIRKQMYPETVLAARGIKVVS